MSRRHLERWTGSDLLGLNTSVCQYMAAGRRYGRSSHELNELLGAYAFAKMLKICQAIES